jgi:alanine racemase
MMTISIGFHHCHQSALLHNLSVVKKYAPQAKVVAMVKANAYGHHLDLVTPLLENADILAVSEQQISCAIMQIGKWLR